MPSFLKSFMSFGRYKVSTDGPIGSGNSGVGSGSRVSETVTTVTSVASMSHHEQNHNQTVSDNNKAWMNQALNYLNVTGDGDGDSSQGSSSGQSVLPQPPKPVEEVVKENSDILQALVLLQFEQHEMNISFRNQFATSATQFGGLNRKISEFEKELQELKRHIIQRPIEDAHQDQHQQQQSHGFGNDQQEGHLSRRLAEGNLATPASVADVAGTACPYCHGSYINLHTHIRFHCHQSPEQLQGDRVPCPFCEKYYSKRYLKVHSRRFCRVA